MTRVCSPRMTHRCTKMVHLARGQRGVLAPAARSVPMALPLAGPVTHDDFCWKMRALPAVGANDGNPPRTPSAWMISLVSLLPIAPNRVLGVGHSNRAEVGHSW